MLLFTSGHKQHEEYAGPPRARPPTLLSQDHLYFNAQSAYNWRMLLFISGDKEHEEFKGSLSRIYDHRIMTPPPGMMHHFVLHDPSVTDGIF
uniref:Uncharacterized protein n=1 Tax=Trachysalambria curvirostris nimavirus TaxID=2984282 RepID=A0A9C7C064_9VIRU|nr:MAG: hypothetical protein [Trachysalambria curvirostris nimavirus]